MICQRCCAHRCLHQSRRPNRERDDNHVGCFPDRHAPFPSSTRELRENRRITAWWGRCPVAQGAVRRALRAPRTRRARGFAGVPLLCWRGPSNKGFHPTPLARLVSDGHTRLVVGLVAKALSRSRGAGEAQAVSAREGPVRRAVWKPQGTAMEALPSPRQMSHWAEWGPSFPGRLSLAGGGFWVAERRCVLTPRAPDAAKRRRIGFSHPQGKRGRVR